MHCSSCEKIINRAVKKIEGIVRVKSDYPSQIVEVTYDDTISSLKEVYKGINAKGYRSVSLDHPIASNRKGVRRFFGLLFGLAGIILIVFADSKLSGNLGLPEVSQGMSYGLLFLVGLTTGFHCVGMCGGFVVGYTAGNASAGRNTYTSHFLFGTGKTLSYSFFGAVFGLLGSIVAFTPTIRGGAAILAGVFLLIYGLNMLNVFPALRRFRIRAPGLDRFVGDESRKHTNHPFTIGCLNGLMIACGPLQAMYVMAAGTGSMVEGAKMLFVFGLGTLPVMLGFGVITSFVSGRITQKILKGSGVIVMALGGIMLNRGMIMTGFDIKTLVAGVYKEAVAAEISNLPPMEKGHQVIKMEVTKTGFVPNHFVLRKNVPVIWVINGKELTACNKSIMVPKMGLEFDVKEGSQHIGFVPEKTGVISWSCWMGMMPGSFEVVDAGNTVILSAPPQAGKWVRRGRYRSSAASLR